MHIVGTAGHVDHGKSALIATLTGTHPDRWIEERVRGMTLDLGFAYLRFPDGLEAGIVDVPGHERFLHNMLAGAAGMELLLLVVDAREGVRPQTLEHLAILQFLNVRRVIVVVSKIDLLDRRDIDDACARIVERLRGTIADEAPVIPVSVITGENVEELRAMLHREVIRIPPRKPDAPAYLPVDRVFSLPGLGTIVTGTLMQGKITTGETLVLQPGGKSAHVRGVGVFGTMRACADGGTRVALNVPGLGRDEVSRGHSIVGRELGVAQHLTVHFVPLPDAAPLLRRKTPVRAYFGSAETLGTLVAEEKPSGATEMRARLHLREPVVAFPGLRFVLRRPSPMTLLGGGFVEFGAAALSDGGNPHELAVLSVLRASGLEPLEISTIAAGANLLHETTTQTLSALLEREEVIALARPCAYVDASAAQTLFERALGRIEQAHKTEPWAMGSTSILLARELGVSESLLVRVLEHFVAKGCAIKSGGYYAAVGHRPSLTEDQRYFFDRLMNLDEAQLRPASFAAAATAVKASRIAGVGKAFDTMLARGSLVKIGGDLYSAAQIGRVYAEVEKYLRDGKRMTAAEFRDLVGTSRKYAVPLLEWLDGQGVTIRSGDYRTLRTTPNG